MGNVKLRLCYTTHDTEKGEEKMSEKETKIKKEKINITDKEKKCWGECKAKTMLHYTTLKREEKVNEKETEIKKERIKIKDTDEKITIK